jgi:hypothetical protein
MIKKVTIYGERCSGTNYLEQLLINNFDIDITWKYGWKHFFGFHNLDNSDDVLFIGIIRNINDWINSLYREKYHLPESLIKDEISFLNNEFYSIDINNNEIMHDRNIETKERYKNIFELKHIKNKFLVDTMPKLVKNYILIRYEDLLNNFKNTMYKISNFNLPIKNNIEFPLNIFYYRNEKNVIYKKCNLNTISSDLIIKNANMYYEN